MGIAAEELTVPRVGWNGWSFDRCMGQSGKFWGRSWLGSRKNLCGLFQASVAGVLVNHQPQANIIIKHAQIRSAIHQGDSILKSPMRVSSGI